MKKILLACLLTTLPLSSTIANEAAKPAVIVHTVRTSDVTPTFKLIGRIEASQRVNIFSRVSGYLQQRLFDEGRDVSAEQSLFKIDPSDYLIAQQQAQADLASAKAALKNTQAKLDRSTELRRRKAISQADLDQAEADRDQARAQVLKAGAGLKKADLDLSYTDIKAPFSGRIGKATYATGELISSQSGALATIVKLDPIYVEMSISEKLMLDARRSGLQLDNPPVAPTLVLSDGSRYEYGGQFDFVAPEVDTNTDTISIRASFPNPNALLLPGEFVHVEVKPKQAEQGIRIPQSAVLRDRQGFYVLTVDAQNTVGRADVELGPQNQGLWQLISGLNTGDRIITEGLQKVSPGVQVKAVEE